MLLNSILFPSENKQLLFSSIPSKSYFADKGPSTQSYGVSSSHVWMWVLGYKESESESEVAQSCPTLHDPMDCSLPDSSVHGIFWARVWEWVAILSAKELMFWTVVLEKALESPLDCKLDQTSQS